MSEENTNTPCWIEELLPTELLWMVLRLLPRDAVGVAARTCRRWFSSCPEELRYRLSARGACSSLALLQWALGNGYSLQHNTIAAAARKGQLEVVRWLHEERGREWAEDICAEAARHGHLEVLKWVREQGCPWNADVCLQAALNGRVEVLRWALEQGCPAGVWTFRGAAESAVAGEGLSLDLVDVRRSSREWGLEDVAMGTGAWVPLGQRRVRVCSTQWGALLSCPLQHCQTSRLCRVWFQGGHLEVLKWARENGCPWDKTVFMMAAARGHLEVVKWAHENGCPWDKDVVCYFAAKGGNLEVLKWAREQGCSWGSDTTMAAARRGDLEMLKWAHENGCPWTADTCCYAAEGGHLEVVKWAREHGCPWTEYTCQKAATEGHLKVLKWARANGCPWDEWTCRGAARMGRVAVLKWARENGCPWDEQTYSDALLYPEMEQWLRQHEAHKSK
ncbi:Ankyrin repeat domain-containing protein [Balamuthia mandrillaris]